MKYGPVPRRPLAAGYLHDRYRPLFRRICPPRGATFVEFVVAMVVLGIALSGMFPLLVVQSRAVESLELRYTEKGGEINQGKHWFAPVHRNYLEDNLVSADARNNYGPWYLSPSDDAWARKLGAAATLVGDAPLSAEEAVFDLDDDEDAGNNDYTEESGGVWTTSSDDGGYQNDSRRHAAADPRPAAAWTLTKIPPGRYNVLATWPTLESAEPPEGDTAGFSVYTVSGGVETQHGDEVTVSQYSSPDLAYDGRMWKLLTAGNPCTIGDGSVDVRVRVRALGDESIVADAVLLVPVNIVELLSVERSSTSDATTATVGVTPALE